MIKRLDVLFILLLLCGSLSALESSDIFARSNIDSISRSLQEIDAAANRDMRMEIPQTAVGQDQDATLPKKMERGNSLFEQGDYAAAADMFYSVVTLHQDNDEMRRTAVFKLAESLYNRKNYISAAKYYETLLSDTESQDYRRDSLKRMVEASYYTGSYDDVKKYYNMFTESGYDLSSEQELVYFFGKSLFYNNRFSEAVNVFYSIDKNADFYPQSRYFLGILSIREHEYDDALSFFEEIANLNDKEKKYHNFRKVRELSVLAAARISFETGNLDKAAEHYLSIDKKSASAAEAYYELGWTYIKKGDYEKAVETLHSIKSFAPASPVVPQAEALEGNLLVQMKKYDSAMPLFDSMVKKYGRIQNELFVIDGKVFMMNGAPRKVVDFLLPYSPMIVSLLKDNKKFTNAMRLNNSVLAMEEELKQVESRSSRISAMVSSKEVAAAYPPLKSRAIQVLSLRDGIASVKHKIVTALRKLSEKSLTPEQKSELDGLDAKKREILGIPASKKLYVNPAKIRGRAEEYSKRVGNDENDIVMIVNELASMSKELERIILFYAKAHKFSDEDGKKNLDMVISERDALRDMILESEYCSTELASEKDGILFGGIIEANESRIRDSLNKLSDRQFVILRGVNSDIEALMAEAGRIDRKLVRYYRSLNDAAKKLVDNVLVSYEKEKNEIDGFRSEFAGIRREAEEMAVLAMYSDMNNVKTAVSEYVLQGDLGIVDVLWDKKEDDSAEIVRLKTQKAQEIQQLYLNLDGEK